MGVPRRFASLLPLVFVFGLTSCGDDEIAPDVSRRNPAPEVQVVRPAARVTDDGLRVRREPRLDADIVGRLMADDEVVVESRTSWDQSIADRDAPWFFIRTPAFSGWTYGGYLDFGSVGFAGVPVDPAQPRPRLAEAGAPSATGLPALLLPIFGMEAEPDIPALREGSIAYDPLHESLILPLSGGDESTLIGEELLLVVESPKHRYSRRYGAGEPDLLRSGGRQAAVIPFYRLATLDRGPWEAYAFVGGEDWPAAVGRMEIEAAELSLVARPEPDPLRDSPHGIYKPADTVYAFGRRKGGKGPIQVALYRDTGEFREGQVVLEPAALREPETRSDGFWTARFELDDSYPPGRYWAASGDPIESLDDLHVLVTSVTLQAATDR